MDIDVLSYIGIVWPKEHFPEVWSVSPVTPCIFPNYKLQDAKFLDLFISTIALHVSGGSSAHHQEHKTVHTASDIVNLMVELNELQVNLYTRAQDKTCVVKIWVSQKLKGNRLKLIN